jgi:hypothetical protein
MKWKIITYNKNRILISFLIKAKKKLNNLWIFKTGITIKDKTQITIKMNKKIN